VALDARSETADRRTMVAQGQESVVAKDVRTAIRSQLYRAINPALNYMKLKHGCGKVRPWLKKTVAERPRTRVSSCASKR
jgi:hypothetical protein